MSTAVWAQEAVALYLTELARLGVHHAVFCPGSRSTPLVLGLARHGGFHLWQHLDERSAGFFGLGIARWLEEPVLLVSTSGTAVANFAPAVVEASMSAVPLLVCTADRPPELQGVGANQAIPQSGFFGRFVRWSLDLPLPDGNAIVLRRFRTAAQQAVAMARGRVPGPVHLNFPFREPLVAADAEVPGRTLVPAMLQVGILDEKRAVANGPLDLVSEQILRAKRGVFIVGAQRSATLASVLTELASRLCFPILADGLSGLRWGPHYSPVIIDAYEALLRESKLRAVLTPDVIVRIGAAPIAKPLLELVEFSPCPQIVVDGGEWADPFSTATTIWQGEPAAFCQALLERLGEEDGAREERWLAQWQEWQRQARIVLTAGARSFVEAFEGRIFVELGELLPEGSILFAGNSMPVRDLDIFLTGGRRSLRVLANRGASGIDGVVSTALGVAAASGQPVVLVIGDLSFYHDMNGLLMARQYGLPLIVVLVHNDGGGIFSFLPQAEERAYFEQLFGTPHGLDFRAAALLYGGAFHDVHDWQQFARLLQAALCERRWQILQVRTNRERNVAQHRELWQAVARSLMNDGREVVRTHGG